MKGLLVAWLADLPPPTRVSIDQGELTEGGGAKNHPSPPSHISMEVEGLAVGKGDRGVVLALRFEFPVTEGDGGS